jgi:hypothetical protein
LVLAELLLLVGALAHIVFLCMHRTLGGWHFGQRYTNDLLPAALLGIALVAGRIREERQNALAALVSPLTAYGFALNIAGILHMFNS